QLPEDEHPVEQYVRRVNDQQRQQVQLRASGAVPVASERKVDASGRQREGTRGEIWHADLDDGWIWIEALEDRGNERQVESRQGQADHKGQHQGAVQALRALLATPFAVSTSRDRLHSGRQ